MIGAQNFDRATIAQTVRVIHAPGNLIELRIPKAGRYKTISGYFDDPQAFVDAVISLADEGFEGYYITINPCIPDLLARSCNKYERYAKNTTSDNDILRRRWLPIDLDPIRPAGISSSEAEHLAALDLAREIRGRLISRGWPESAFVLADSGNGGHLVARIDLPNDEAARYLVKGCLEALDFLFSDEKVKVDTSTSNAARIWKLYGTMARKGSDTEDRPHRLARILEATPLEDQVVVSNEQLEALRAILPKAERQNTNAGQGQAYRQGRDFDPVKYAEAHGASVRRTKSWQGGTLAILEVCPFNKDHDRGESFLGVQSSGAIYFGCPHDSCQGNDWQALKKLWGVPKIDHKARMKESAAKLESIKKERIKQKFKPDEQPPEKGQDIEIKAKALDVMKNGDPVKYILDTLAVYHAGDRRSAELLLCSVAIGSILNANGTQPKLSGGSGKGKTHLCRSLRHLMPPEWVLFTSLSPKAIYYDFDIKPGMVIFSDDVRVSVDLEDTLKRAMSNFQEPSVYKVVNKDRSIETRYLPERLIWWLTSVADDQEEQLINRFFSVGVDESSGQDQASLKLTFAPLALGRQEFPLNAEVLVCREIIRELKSKTWMVHAPFLMDNAGNLNVSWQNPEDRRNPGRFVDLLAAYAVLYSGQRETHEEDCYHIVVATPADFEAAKDLYESRAENLTTKLTDRELHFVRWLKQRAGKSEYEFKINDISKIYHGTDGKGLSPRTLERMLLGRSDRNSHGLIDKIKSGGLTVEIRSDTESIDDGSRKRQRRYNLFTFDPSKFNSLEAYSSVVFLKDNNRTVPPSPENVPPFGAVPDNPPDIKKIYNIDGKIPRVLKETKTPPDARKNGNSSFSLKVGASGTDGTFEEPNNGLVGTSNGTIQGTDGVTRPKGGRDSTKKKLGSYSEMAGSVPYDTSSLEAEKICRAFRGLLFNGIAPRLEFLAKETCLESEIVEAYLNGAAWIHKDASSPSGIIVYLPVEAYT